MKRIGLYLILLVTVCGCKDVLDAEMPSDFTVTSLKNTYRVGEEVEFLLSGNPKIVNFYSGEFGNNYDSIGGRKIPPGKIEFSFSLRYNYPTRTPSTFFVLASSDFNGERNSFEAIKAATWTDITSRCVIKKEDAYISSGKVDVSDLVVKDKPLYFAYKYVFDPTKGSVGAVMWINSVQVTSETENGKLNLSSTLINDFLSYSTGNPDKNPIRSDNRSSNLVMWSNAPTAIVDGKEYTNKTYTEEYFVSKGYPVSAVLDAGPDKPITIKSYSDARLKSYKYAFKRPGVYKVVFEGINPTIQKEERVMHEVHLTVED